MSLRDPEVDSVYRKMNEKVMFQSTWRGVRAVKNPCDAWIYQELIYKYKPDVIIETGSYFGGSALMLSDFCGNAGKGRIITIEVEPENRRQWVPTANVHHILGSSSADPVVEEVKSLIRPGESVMVILDSDHHKEHVAEELRLYAPLVTKEQYLIIEDTWWRPGSGGPWDAVEPYIYENRSKWRLDKDCERYLFTNNPNGFYQRL